VLAGLFLFLRFVDDLFPALMSPAAPVGRFMQRGVGLSDPALEQVGVLLSGLFRVLLLVVGWAAILARFGASVDDVVARVTSTRLVIRLGQLSISPAAILGGLAVFLLGVAITRAVRRWIELRYLPKTRLDLGVRTSLAAGVSYLGVLVAVLLACAYLGLSLDRIALLASALSVGIGFGLQAVIGNFVSGLILLVERPLKVGDWIAIGDLEGDVRRINIRATEIEMSDRSKLIVPNSDLISKTVRNVTHASALGRVKIVLKTVNDADPATVRDILLAEMGDHDEVLAEPAAAVFLTDVPNGALEFSAFAYVASARQAYKVKSDLLFRIVPALKARGIVLADPAPVVHVAMPDRLIEATPTGS
jgi:small-conductance mechanosensitive channel